MHSTISTSFGRVSFKIHKLILAFLRPAQGHVWQVGQREEIAESAIAGQETLRKTENARAAEK